MLIEVVVTFAVPGFHYWPGAPDSVAFLRDRHRHVFWFKCWKRVSHDNRDIEIITLKNEIQAWAQHGEFGSSSCEQLARFAVDRFGLTACEVLEDGENGAKVTA